MGWGDPEPKGWGPVPDHENPYLSDFDSKGHLTRWGEESARINAERIRRSSEGARYVGSGGYSNGSREGPIAQIFGWLSLISVLVIGGMFWGSVLFEAIGWKLLWWPLGIGIALYVAKRLWRLLLIGVLAFGLYLFFGPRTRVNVPMAPAAVKPTAAETKHPTAPSAKRVQKGRPKQTAARPAQ
jgi:hypothetical protein